MRGTTAGPKGPGELPEGKLRAWVNLPDHSFEACIHGIILSQVV
jgi:hypothetical protein